MNCMSCGDYQPPPPPPPPPPPELPPPWLPEEEPGAVAAAEMAEAKVEPRDVAKCVLPTELQDLPVYQAGW
jgi:hypothetical protein